MSDVHHLLESAVAGHKQAAAAAFELPQVEGEAVAHPGEEFEFVAAPVPKNGIRPALRLYLLDRYASRQHRFGDGGRLGIVLDQPNTTAGAVIRQVAGKGRALRDHV
jgi:hypothetical protein